MTRPAERADMAAEQFRLLRIIWIAFLAAVVVYALIAWLVVAEGVDHAPPPPPGVRSGLYFAALGAAVSSFVTKRWWINSALAAVGSPSGAQVGDDAWARLRIGCMISWALSEAVAIIGLTLAIIARRPLDAVPFAAAAALLLVWHRPASWPLQALRRAGGRA
jgi:F0F1-type ATP synthase membrane subunit c/vacuolar-type H+-ATPase subunit K